MDKYLSDTFPNVIRVFNFEWQNINQLIKYFHNWITWEILFYETSKYKYLVEYVECNVEGLVVLVGGGGGWMDHSYVWVNLNLFRLGHR